MRSLAPRLGDERLGWVNATELELVGDVVAQVLSGDSHWTLGPLKFPVQENWG